MQIRKLALSIATALVASAGLSQAVLTNFTDFNYGGNTASWDIFYGANYLPTFTFATGTVGNPSDTAQAINLVAVNPGYVAGNFGTYATGPLDSNGSTIPGNRELFYTFFANPVKFTITGLVTGTELDNIAFQALVGIGSNGSITNVSLNNVAAATSGITSGVNFWTWNDLNLTQGSRFTLTFETNVQHIAFDAFQIQTDTTVVPEPSTYALIVIGLALVLVRFRKRLA